jgi:hypothetical protein
MHHVFKHAGQAQARFCCMEHLVGSLEDKLAVHAHPQLPASKRSATMSVGPESMSTSTFTSGWLAYHRKRVKHEEAKLAHRRGRKQLRC